MAKELERDNTKMGDRLQKKADEAAEAASYIALAPKPNFRKIGLIIA